MSKFVQAILTGMLIVFILDFFLFLGIFLNYIQYYEIDVYYNILFWDHQNWYLYGLASIILGLIVTYIPNYKATLCFVTFLFILSLSTLIQGIGYSIGESILMEKNTTYNDSRFTFVGDSYYVGREQITFYDYELKKIILLDKKDLR